MQSNPAGLQPNRHVDQLERVNVLGVGIHDTNPREAVKVLDQAIETGKRGYACVTGVHGIMESQADPDLQRIHNGSLLTVPDGMPNVWIGRGKGHKTMQRTYGPDLMLDVCAHGVPKGRRHFFYGGKEGIADQLKERLEEKFPGLHVVGTYCPPFRPLTDDEEADLAQRVQDAKPDYFWVGLSTPKQERFMHSHQHLETHIMLGVGAAFDLHTGHMTDSPNWVKKCGLQWFHRMCQEPKRLGPRYLINNPKFLWKITLQLGRIKHYKLETFAHETTWKEANHPHV